MRSAGSDGTVVFDYGSQMAHHTDSVVVFCTAAGNYGVAVGAAGMAVRDPGMPNREDNSVVHSHLVLGVEDIHTGSLAYGDCISNVLEKGILNLPLKYGDKTAAVLEQEARMTEPGLHLVVLNLFPLRHY